MADVAQGPGISERIATRRSLFPVAVTLMLIVWTVLVSAYGEYWNWALLPALLALPVVVMWHIGLIAILKGQRSTAVIFGVVHIIFLAPIWYICLLKISKADL